MGSDSIYAFVSGFFQHDIFLRFIHVIAVCISGLFCLPLSSSPWYGLPQFAYLNVWAVSGFSVLHLVGKPWPGLLALLHAPNHHPAIGQERRVMHSSYAPSPRRRKAERWISRTSAIDLACHLPAVWLWPGNWTFLCCSFFICKMGSW